MKTIKKVCHIKGCAKKGNYILPSGTRLCSEHHLNYKESILTPKISKN